MIMFLVVGLVFVAGCSSDEDQIDQNQNVQNQNPFAFNNNSARAEFGEFSGNHPLLQDLRAGEYAAIAEEIETNDNVFGNNNGINLSNNNFSGSSFSSNSGNGSGANFLGRNQGATRRCYARLSFLQEVSAGQDPNGDLLVQENSFNRPSNTTNRVRFLMDCDSSAIRYKGVGHLDFDLVAGSIRGATQQAFVRYYQGTSVPQYEIIFLNDMGLDLRQPRLIYGLIELRDYDQSGNLVRRRLIQFP